VSGAWQRLPWRAGTNGVWQTGVIPGDWPLKQVEVDEGEAGPQRFFKVRAVEE